MSIYHLKHWSESGSQEKSSKIHKKTINENKLIFSVDKIRNEEKKICLDIIGRSFNIKLEFSTENDSRWFFS